MAHDQWFEVICFSFSRGGERTTATLEEGMTPKDEEYENWLSGLIEKDTEKNSNYKAIKKNSTLLKRLFIEQ